jgi:ATP-dependent helicase/nuclease subunit B
LAIIDYKTGVVPSTAEVIAGLAPQLSLEAAIAAAGGFEDIAAAAVGELAYWRLTGAEQAGEIKRVKADAMALAEAAEAGLRALIARFDDPATPYLARPDAARAPRFSDYEHLARVKEWSDPARGEET